MSLFKCKMCGGTLEINNNETVATCEYCGTQQTLPKMDDDHRVNLYDRANHFRRNNEFDKAMGIYERILNEDPTDAEAYWSIVLCRYGIEYVEDLATRSRIPTVNRAQFTSIFDDEDYKSALQCADNYQKEIYEREAVAINNIQKGILAISSQEEPFDVFICYKESDANGRRTPDSVLATELYHELTREGYKVFFSRITLEDKLGSAYEPYIFAALNSSKVMVVLGTKPEYFNAVWVKNEWSRYLSLIKNGARKMLIPAYKDMDPYDLPEEFSHLQAQDMSKLGFIQDLVRGIKKIAQIDDPKATVVNETVIVNGNLQISPLLKRAFMFLEDEEWNSANEYCEKILDINPECAEAYLGKLMVGLRVRTQDALREQEDSFENDSNYQKAIRFADEKLKATLIEYVECINERIEYERLDAIYNRGRNALQRATTEKQCEEAALIFESISEHLDSADLVQKCYVKAEEIRKDNILSLGISKMNSRNISSCEEAIELFKSIPGWKDADENINKCEVRILAIQAECLERERIKKKTKKIVAISTPIGCAVLAFIIVLINVIIPNEKYGNAIALMNAEKYSEAISVFESLGDYKDSEDKLDECNYAYGIALMNAEKYSEAISVFDTLGVYKDSVGKINECNYAYANELMDSENLDKAYDIFKKLWNYKDSAKKLSQIRNAQFKNAKVGDVIKFGSYEQDNNNSNGKEEIEWLVLDIKDGKILVLSKYALDNQPYNNEYANSTWASCTLRKWLNGFFINAAFSTEEKTLIPTVTVSADKNPDFDTNPGKATQDQVFLLSMVEANKYLSEETKQCEGTSYFMSHGGYSYNIYTNTCRWWLRTPGLLESDAVEVSSIGECNSNGVMVNDKKGIRPAMWIDIKN